MLNTKWLASVGLVACLLGVAACGDSEGQESSEANSGASSRESTPSEDQSSQDGGSAGEDGGATEQGDMPEADVEDVPDVVAEVNGEEISKKDFVAAYEGQFQQMAMQSQMSGEPVDQDTLKAQMLESMIGTELLIQEADQREFSASDKEVDQSLEDMASQSGLGSTDEFLAAVQEQGMDEKEARSQVATQVKVDKLIAEDTDVPEPTDEELKELYDRTAAQQGQQGGQEGQQQVPSFEEIKPQLKEQVKSQKEGQAVQALIDDLRQDADVTTHL